MGSHLTAGEIDPVTTESKDEIASPARIPGKSMSAITRRPQAECKFLAYISGYVDGEGCFTVSISKRAKMRLGWELRPSFSVSQNRDRAKVLNMMMDYFQCGTIRPDRSDNTLKYEVRSLDDLERHIIPHFEEYPLLSEKNVAFWQFRQIVLEMKQGSHLVPAKLQNMMLRATLINNGLRRYRFEKI